MMMNGVTDRIQSGLRCPGSVLMRMAHFVGKDGDPSAKESSREGGEPCDSTAPDIDVRQRSEGPCHRQDGEEVTTSAPYGKRAGRVFMFMLLVIPAIAMAEGGQSSLGHVPGRAEHRLRQALEEAQARILRESSTFPDSADFRQKRDPGTMWRHHRPNATYWMFHKWLDGTVMGFRPGYFESWILDPVYGTINISGDFTITPGLGVNMYSATGTVTITLPPVATSAGRFMWIKNKGTGIVTIDGAGSDVIDDETTQVLYLEEGVFLWTEGTEWFVN